MDRRCPLCRWWVLGPLLLGLSLLAMLGGCAMVESDVESRARDALAAAGVSGVAVDVDYRDVTLTGPASARDGSLAAVGGLDAVRDVSFTGTSASAPLPQTGELDLTGRIAGGAITLSGAVASEDERAELVSAAEAAFGTGNVVDQLTVGAGGSADADAAVGALAALMPDLASGLESGEATLTATALDVTGQARTASAVAGVAGSVEGVGTTTLTATSAIEPPVAPARRAADLEARLRGVARRSSITFATGSAEFGPGATAVLDRVASLIGPAARQVPSLRVQVQGHTDDRGDATANRGLSERRAQAVVDYIASRGVPRARLEAVGFGESRPVGDNATEAGRLKNRRIDFDVRS